MSASRRFSTPGPSSAGRASGFGRGGPPDRVVLSTAGLGDLECVAMHVAHRRGNSEALVVAVVGTEEERRALMKLQGKQVKSEPVHNASPLLDRVCVNLVLTAACDRTPDVSVKTPSTLQSCIDSRLRRAHEHQPYREVHIVVSAGVRAVGFHLGRIAPSVAVIPVGGPDAQLKIEAASTYNGVRICAWDVRDRRACRGYRLALGPGCYCCIDDLSLEELRGELARLDGAAHGPAENPARTAVPAWMVHRERAAGGENQRRDAAAPARGGRVRAAPRRAAPRRAERDNGRHVGFALRLDILWLCLACIVPPLNIVILVASVL